MRKTPKLNRILISASIVLLCTALHAQATGSVVYAISAPQEAISAETVQVLDGHYNTFNEVFHFSKTGPGFLFPVTLFNTIEDYKTYVTGKTGGVIPASDAVFLRYNNAQRSEVAAVVTTITKPVFIRQLFLQYLTYYMNDYPQWLFGGYTLIFENFDKGQNPWLETAKKLAADSSKKLSLTQILSAQKNDYTSDRLFPQAMMLVNFLEQNANNTYRRLLFEGIADIKAAKSAQESFDNYIAYWIGEEQADDDFSVYVSSIKTAGELLAEGIAAYTQNEWDRASAYFLRVIELDTKNSTAWYYAGLTAYKQKNYSEADKQYKKALETGSPAALVNWALAVNAYEDARYSDAAIFAAQSKMLDRAAYGQRADELILSIPQGQKGSKK